MERATGRRLTNFIFEEVTYKRFDYRRTRYLYPLFRSDAITTEVARNTAELILLCAEKNKVIVKKNINSLSDTFAISIKTSNLLHVKPDFLISLKLVLLPFQPCTNGAVIKPTIN